MKLHPNVGLIIAAFALGVTLAGTANAQLTVVRDAHFTLPFQARCADTVLPAKDYTLSVVRLSGGGYAKYAVHLPEPARIKLSWPSEHRVVKLVKGAC